MRWTRFSILMLLAAGCSGMAPRDSREIPVEVLHRGLHCGEGAKGPTVGWIASGAEWTWRLQRMERERLGDETPARVDFRERSVVLAAMGRRPTGGYALDLAGPTARVVDGVLEVTVDWVEPTAGAAVAQVLTDPCLVVSVPAGEYRGLRVRDKTGQVRAESFVE